MTEYRQKRVLKACDKCGRSEEMVCRTATCIRCRMEAHRVHQLAYSHKHQAEINAKNKAYYHATKILKGRTKAVPVPPSVPETPIPWHRVEATIKAGGCCRCGEPAFKASLCRRHIGEYARQKRKKKVDLRLDL